MNLRHLSDEVLLLEIRNLACREREVLTKILHHLKEVDDRRLYSTLKCTSLFDYAVRELKYSEGQAARRIQAMRALTVMPEIEAKISSGELSLSNVAMVQTTFVKERKAGRHFDRRAAFKKIENLSTREAEKAIGIQFKKELTFDMIADVELRQEAIRVVGKYAHLKLSLEQVLHRLFDQELQPAPESRSPKKFALHRDQRACVNCGSTFALQVDHIVPKALGGTDSPENLRVLCRSCNQRAAIVHFGLEKMAEYFKGPDP